MRKQSLFRRTTAFLTLAAVVLALSAVALQADDQKKDSEGWVELFNGRDFSGWTFKDESGAEAWKVVSDVSLDPNDPSKLVGQGQAQGKNGVMLRGPIDHGSDVYTEKEFGDGEYHVEFMVPKSSNSGVYLQGQYEVQVLDSYGKEQVGTGDVGGIYATKAPSQNAAKAPGQWQTFHIVFRAPRFDASGKKTENAKFVRVDLNGKTIHENVEVPNPTGGQLPGGEKPMGPLMFQGDHGIVAFRNVKYRPLDKK